MKILLAVKPSLIDICNKYGLSALYVASCNGHVEAMKILLAAKPSLIDVYNKDGVWALQIATTNGHVEATALLENYWQV